MKLKTKLIPLTSLAAIGATVAPIALTSCGTKTDANIDLTSWYTPSITKHANTLMNDEEAYNALFYTTNANGEKELKDGSALKEDFVWSGAAQVNLVNINGKKDEDAKKIEIRTKGGNQTYYYFEDLDTAVPAETLFGSNMEAQSLDVLPTRTTSTYNVSKYNINFNYFKLAEDYKVDGTTKIVTLSYELTYDYEYTVSNNYSSGNGQTSFHHYGTVKVTNFPITVQSYSKITSDRTWNVCADIESIMAAEQALESGAGYAVPYAYIDEYTSEETYSYSSGTSGARTSTSSSKGNIQFCNGMGEEMLFVQLPQYAPAFTSYYLFSCGYKSGK